jgi:lambda family phage portal protein
VQISEQEHSDACAFLAQLSAQAKRRDAQSRTMAQLLRQTNEAFRWGRLDRSTRHFDPPARSGDSATLESDDRMHRRTRSEDLNNAQVKRVVDALGDLVVGCGMQTFADPFSADVSIDDLMAGFEDELAYALEADDLHEEWFNDAKQFDAQGKQTGPEMQRQAIQECVRVGDALILRVNKPRRGRTIPLCYQIIERDQLCRDKDRSAAKGQNKIVGGIEIDADGVVVAYHLYDEHPYDDFGIGQGYGASTRILAERIQHLCLFRRPSENIGYAWLHAIGQAQFDRDRFMGAEIQSAAKAALILLVAKLKHLKGALNGGTLGLMDGESQVDEYGNQEMRLGSTPEALKIGEDDDIKMVESNRPTDTAESFVGILDHDTAGGAGLSYYTLSGRYDQTNFSSLRGALLAEDGHIRPLQKWFADRIALPMRKEFHAQAVGMGKLKKLDLDDYLAEPRKYSRFVAIGPGRELLDPEAEIDASLAKLRSGQSTLLIENARRNQHWIRVLLQRAREEAITKKLKLTLDFSKGNGGQPGENEGDAPQPKKAAAKKKGPAAQQREEERAQWRNG